MSLSTLNTRPTFHRLLSPALASIAGLALGVPALSAGAQVLNGGFDHTPSGSALLSAAGARKIRATGIGSSGNDGVDVSLRSASGGQVGFAGGGAGGLSFATVTVPLQGTPIEFHSTIETIAGGTATITHDFSDFPPTDITVEIYNGPTLINTYTEPGPILMVPEVPDNYCPDGSPAIPYWKWVVLCNSCSPVWVVGWTCANGDVYSYNDGTARVVVTPNYPVGTFPPIPFGDARVRTTNGPDLDVHAPALATFGLESWGLHNARVTEDCAGPAPCGPDDAIVRASNLSTLGDDGVAVNFGPNSAGAEIAVERNINGWDLKEAKKFYDDGNQEVMRVTHNPPGNPASDVQLQFDFPADMTDVEVGLYDDSGTLLDSFVVPTSTGTVVLDPAWLCPPPQYPVYGYDYNTQKWYFLTCAGGFEMVTPGGNPVTGITKVTLAPVGAPAHRVRRAEVLGSSSQGDLLVARAVGFPCPADVTGDGVVDLEDFFQFLNDFDNTAPGADINGDNVVDLEDFFLFLNAFDASC